MSRISTRLAARAARGQKALIPFITAGDPAPQDTVRLLRALVQGGADIIEVGVPFSDPMADGPTIQRASERALKHGTSLTDVLAMVKEFRAGDSDTPIVLMGYANPIEAMGRAQFAAAAKAAGADAVLVVDYPPEECADFTGQLRRAGLEQIFLLAPTSTASRISAVAALASGYIYYVSLRGVTGANHLDMNEVLHRLDAIRKQVKLPIGVGFGIRDAATAAAVSRAADAVVIGSRIIEELENAPAGTEAERVTALLAEMRAAMDAAAH
jgi:tryptophan synthase alpha chain